MSRYSSYSLHSGSYLILLYTVLVLVVQFVINKNLFILFQCVWFDFLKKTYANLKY